MKSLLKIETIKLKRNTLLFAAILSFYLIVAYYFLSTYFIVDLNFAFGIILAPYILKIKREEYSFRFAIPMFIFLVLFYFIPLKSVFFLIILFAALFLVESCKGSITAPFFALLLILSPVFDYLTNVFGFPVRLWLSKVSGNILQVILKNVEVAGNIILINGNSFSVDPACTGLQMLVVSFIISVFIIAYHQKKQSKSFSIVSIVCFLGITVLLNIFCNLVRIITLVMFRIFPENILHDITGLICLAVYVFLPLVFVSKCIFKKEIRIKEQVNRIKIGYKHRSFVANFITILSMVCTVVAGYHLHSLEKDLTEQGKVALTGYKKEILQTGVVKFVNSDALVYFKPMKFYNASHSPLICWAGSGYTFNQVGMEKIKGMDCYIGTIKKDKEQIYTAWWFDNGKHSTTSETDWRWRAFIGEPGFCLINVNAASVEKLHSSVEEIIKNKCYF